MELYKKYLEEAEKLYNEGNLPQAGEKYYGAVAELLKMIGEKKGWEHSSHDFRRNIIKILDKDPKKPQKIDLWSLHRCAEKLHENFFENFLTKEDFKEDVERTKCLISYLEKILEEL